MKYHTHIVVVLDRSGSMAPLQNDTIGGFNKFLEEQKAHPRPARFSLYTFSTESRLVCDSIWIKQAVPLNSDTYRPEGGTALLDALSMAIINTGAYLRGLKESDRPQQVLFLVITDGEENSSRFATLDKVKEQITHQREKYSWEFIFMGANVDSFSVAKGMGMPVANAYFFNANERGFAASYKAASEGIGAYRSTESKTSANILGITTGNKIPDEK